MKIEYDGVSYELDAESAIQKGLMKKTLETATIEITSDEAAVLATIFRSIGGSPRNARGCCDDVYAKVREAFNGIPETKFDLSMASGGNSIYFKQ